MSTVAAGGVMCTATRRSTGALNGKAILTYEATGRTNFRSGSWLCKNAKTLNRDRRNYSSKTALVAQLASEFNLEVELKNIIPVVFRFFEFLHSQGQKRKSWPCGRMSALPR
jgi:hypothetical protein